MGLNWEEHGGVIGGLGAGLGYFLGSRDSDAPGEGVKLGYQGEIPDYSLVREQVLDAHDPSMLPGTRGKRYFSDFRYMPMSDPAGIAGVRQDLFNQANVGPDSLRAQNYARQGVSDRLPDLGDRGPTGINTVVGAPFNYSQRGLASGEARTYTMADVDDASKTQYFRDGTIYVPDYGFVNIRDAASIAGLTTGYLAPGYIGALAAGAPPEGDPGEGDPGEGDPGEGEGGEPPAESFVSRNAWGEQASPGSYTEDIWSGASGYVVVDVEGNMSWAATEQEAIDIVRESTPPSANNGQNFSTMQAWENQASPGSYTQDIWSQYGGWLVVDSDGNKFRVATEEEAIQERLRTTTPDAPPDDPVDYYNPDSVVSNQQGGLISLMGGGYLSGATDGMADNIYTTIDNTQPAALSDGEFVVAADVVSHLGNGNSDAGAEQLYAMMDEIRMDRTGTKNQGRQINPNQYMPRGVA